MPPKKKRKLLTSEEVLKDIQNFLDEEDNENISDEDVNLDELYGEKSIFVFRKRITDYDGCNLTKLKLEICF